MNDSGNSAETEDSDTEGKDFDYGIGIEQVLTKDIVLSLHEESFYVVDCLEPCSLSVSRFPEQFISRFRHSARFNAFFCRLRSPEVLKIGIESRKEPGYFLTWQY